MLLSRHFVFSALCLWRLRKTRFISVMKSRLFPHVYRVLRYPDSGTGQDVAQVKEACGGARAVSRNDDRTAGWDS